MPEIPKNQTWPWTVLRGGRAAEKAITDGKHDAELTDLYFYSRAHAPADMTDRIAARLRALNRPVPGPTDTPEPGPKPPAPMPEKGALWNLLRAPDAEQRVLRGEADKNLEEVWNMCFRHVPGLVATVEERLKKLRKPVPELPQASVYVPDPRNYTDDPNERRGRAA